MDLNEQVTQALYHIEYSKNELKYDAIRTVNITFEYKGEYKSNNENDNDDGEGGVKNKKKIDPILYIVKI